NPLRASDNTIYWATPNGKGMTRSTDDGQTWTDVIGPGVILSSQPVELPGGRLATLGPQAVMVSADKGAHWNPATAALPFGHAVGVAYSPQQKAFFVWHFTCGTGQVPVPSDAIMRFDFE